MEEMHINWFPGHMKKTRELLVEQLKLIDVVVEILDSRIPKSSRNPEIVKIVKNVPKVILLNKMDLSDDKISKDWINYFEKEGAKGVLINSTTGQGFDEVIKTIKEVTKEKMDNLVRKGRKRRPIRIMVVGIPNVGKSSFINKLIGKKSAKTGDRPGVTKGKQWVRVKADMELLDTPGILWPKFEDNEVAMNLAFTGAIKDEIMDLDEITLEFLKRISKRYPEALQGRFGIEVEDKEPIELFDEIGKKRGCIIAGGEIDYSRASKLIMSEFRGGKLGRITLEIPEDEEI